jgi:hypothetical protein
MAQLSGARSDGLAQERLGFISLWWALSFDVFNAVTVPVHMTPYHHEYSDRIGHLVA